MLVKIRPNAKVSNDMCILLFRSTCKFWALFQIFEMFGHYWSGSLINRSKMYFWIEYIGIFTRITTVILKKVMGGKNLTNNAAFLSKTSFYFLRRKCSAFSESFRIPIAKKLAFIFLTSSSKTLFVIVVSRMTQGSKTFTNFVWPQVS